MYEIHKRVHRVVEASLKTRKRDIMQYPVSGFSVLLHGGEQTEESDVDVYVECPPMGLFRLGSLKNTLEQLFGCRVDIVRLRDHMNAFCENE